MYKYRKLSYVSKLKMQSIVNTIAEIACSEISSNAIDEVSKKTKIPPFHIVSHIDGLAHSHPPCDYEVENCSYCQRNGNVFSNDEHEYSEKNTKSDSIILKYKTKLSVILKELYSEITELATASIVNTRKEESESESDSEEVDEDEIDLESLLSEAFGLK
jgi:hypothetical protein